MNYTVNAEWQLTQPDIDWLDGYIKTRFNEALIPVKEVIAELNIGILTLPSNPWDALHVNLNIFLHASTWFDSLGRADSGLYTYNTQLAIHLDDLHEPKGFNRTDILYDRIEIAWDREMLEGHVLRHEFCHMIARHALLSSWEVFGHGGFGGRLDDPYLSYIKRKIDFLYPVGRQEYPVEWIYFPKIT